MTESEKRRALLADLQSFIGGSCRQGCTHWGCSLRRRVDAALSAEDDGPTTLSEWVDHGMRLTRERDQARAEVEMLRGVGCQDADKQGEPASGPCGVCLKCAFQGGAEAMREKAAVRLDAEGINGVTSPYFGNIIRALPVPGDK